MSENLTLRPIGRIRTEFPEKFGIPRQSGLVEELRAVVEFEREFRAPEAFRGLEGFSHLWLLWHFTQSQGWSPTVRPPRLGGFSDQHREDGLSVDFPPALLEQVPEEKRAALLGVLAQDPRPSYQHDPQRVYGMAFAGLEVRFTVEGNILTVRGIQAKE